MEEKRQFDKRLVAVIRLVGNQLFDRIYRDGQLCSKQFAKDRSLCGISDTNADTEHPNARTEHSNADTEHPNAEHPNAEHPNADTEHPDAEYANAEYANAEHTDTRYADSEYGNQDG
jgi:hypothetical protein